MLLQEDMRTVRKGMDTSTTEQWHNPKFLEQVIKNDIPDEELDIFHQNQEEGDMEFHSPVSYDHYDPNDFHSEEYLEYRRRVYEELASEYDKQQSQLIHSDLISNIPGDYHELEGIQYPLSPTEDYDISKFNSNFNSVVDGSSGDISPTQQVTWDDSDLNSTALIVGNVTSPLLKKTEDKSTDGFRTNLLVLSDSDSDSEKKESSAFLKGQDFSNDTIPSMHWTELEKQLESMTKQHEEELEKSKTATSPPHTPFSPRSRKRSARSHVQKQKNDRQAILQKLTTEDNDSDNFLFGSNKPWYNPRLERGNSQNLQICYINDSCSSSDNDDTTSDSKTSPSSKSGGKSSPMSSPALPSPGFGMRRNMLYRMPSSSSTISVSSTSSNQNSSPSLPNDGEVINIRSSINTDDIPKVRTKQEELEFQARIAITQAHQEAKRLAEQERRKSRKEGSSFEKLLQTPLDDVTRTKVKTRTLTKTDCGSMTIGQLQVILNNMHMEKEALNSELKTILESRDELRTEQDAKLMDVDDMKAMLAVTGPETTV